MKTNERSEKNRIFYEILAFFFAAFIIVLFILCLITPDKEMSVREKRMLSGFPSISARNITSGQFSDDFETYASDQIVFRDLFTKLKVDSDKMIGKVESQGVYKAKDAYLIEKMNPVQDEIVQETLQSVFDFSEKSACSSSFVLVPNAVSIYGEKLPALAVTEDQHAFYNTVSEKMSAKGINTPDLFSVFAKESEEESLYYRSDHHWTSYAAWLSAPAVLESMNRSLSMQYSPLLVTDSFVGSLASKSGYSVSKPDSIHVYAPEREIDYLLTGEEGSGKRATIYSEEGLNSNDPYMVFLGGNEGHIHIDTEMIGKGRLLVFKDSYFNCFLPFLLPEFESIDVIDPRYFSGDLSALLYQNSYDQILYFYNINTFAVDTSLSLVLEEYLNQEEAS